MTGENPISWAAGGLDGSSTGPRDAAQFRTPGRGKLLGGLVPEALCVSILRERPVDMGSPSSMTTNVEVRSLGGNQGHGLQVCVSPNSSAEAHHPHSDGMRRWGSGEEIRS